MAGSPRPLLCATILSISAGGAHPQGQAPIDTLDLAFSKLTINQGLSQGMINTIAQDRQGFMWFGTKDGLNRYDGYSFTIFRHDPADSTSIRENTVTGLHLDRHGRLWVGTPTGVDLFNDSTERFIHLPIHHPDGDWGSVVHLVLDDNGDLWVSTTTSFVKLTFARPFTGHDPPPFTVKWFGDGYATVSRTRDGHLWGNMNECTFRITPRHGGADAVDTIGHLDMATSVHQFGALTVVEDPVRSKVYGVYLNGIAEVDVGTGRMDFIYRIEAGDRWLQSLHPVIDARGMIWFATFRGLYRFDPARRTLSLIRAADPDMREMIATLKWTEIDKDGTIWIGTSGYGLLKYDPRIERFNTWADNSVRALATTRDGQLLVSRYDTYISRFDPRARRYALLIDRLDARWPAQGARLSTQVSEMTVEDRDGVLWSYIADGYMARHDPAAGTLELFLPEPSPGVVDNGFHFPLHIGADSALWCGGDHGLWRIDTRTKEFKAFAWPILAVNNPYPFVTAIHHGADGIVWVGTVKGLLRFNPATNAWKQFAHDPRDPRSLSVETVFSICPDPADPVNVLWIGTNGGGLNRFDARTERFTTYTTNEGLPNNVVYGVLSDALGHLWMSTNKGLSRFDPRTGAFRNFSVGDGLQSDEFNRHAYCKDAQGRLYFGGVSGFNYFDPRALEPDSTPVTVRITGIRLINKPVDFAAPGSPLALPAHMSGGMEIPYSANMVTFTFATMEFAAPELHGYRYLLEGFDAQWIEAGTVNSAVYTNLDPGTYTFRVQGRNRDGIWDTRGTAFTLTVRPPWWMTGWFYTLCALLVIGGARLYLRGLRKQKEHLERMVFVRTHELRREKDRSEELLKNILPVNVAAELKHRGSAAARHFEQVTVLFSDFKEFTQMSERLTPDELVEELNVCFAAFDRIMEKYGVEKIKTIGDAYMAAGGVPDPSAGGPLAVVRAALEMQHIMAERRAERAAQGKVPFEMRVGIHTGPVVAGIVGHRKFQYDIWGDTVNTASRMETTGAVGEVNISQATYLLVKDEPDLEFTPRGRVSTKGKGDLEMYYVRTRSIEKLKAMAPVPPSAPALTYDEMTDRDPTPGADGLKDLRVLLVEDNEFNAMVAVGHLENWVPGVRIDHAVNGAQAVEHVKAKGYDVVLMDIQMPEMNGYDATRAIRALGPDRSRIPIIAMSANVMKAEVDRCIEAGMNDFVPKPYKKEDLMGAIRKVVNARA